VWRLKEKLMLPMLGFVQMLVSPTNAGLSTNAQANFSLAIQANF
jgi:hypothetical protein